jgi:hypothetical protein
VRLIRRASTTDVPAAVLLVAWSFVLFAGMALYASAHDLVFTGADSRLPGDQLQYLAWVTDASEHLLAANRFDLAEPTRVFLHPLWLVSGVAMHLGAGPALALALWKPVAVAVLFLGCRAYARRLIPADGWPRRIALLIALFGFTPALPMIYATGIGGEVAHHHIGLMGGELFNAGFLWGYLPTAIAVGLMPVFLIGVERLLDESRREDGRDRARTIAWTSAAGLLASWLHPWQGETLLVIVGGLVAWDRFRRRNLTLAIPLLATLAPLVYYLALSRLDTSWELVQGNTEIGRYALPVFIAGIAPFVAPALFGLRGKATTPGERMLRLWPAAALAVYFVLSPSWPPHALNGLTIPLAVLSVRGWPAISARVARLRWAPRPWLAAAGVTLSLVGAAPVFLGISLAEIDVAPERDAFLSRHDARAMEHMAGLPTASGVLAPTAVGVYVPTYARRATWIGHPGWTPDWAQRDQDARALFSGRLSRAQARALLDRVGASLVLTPCGSPASLDGALRPLGYAARRFGCATVYTRPRSL